MTHYRQDALRVAHALQAGPLAARALAPACGVKRACALARADYYGWFARPQSGIYTLTDTGHQALNDHAAEVALLMKGTHNAQL
jgi:hypothetical protein